MARSRKFPLEVWIDGAQRVRRLRVRTSDTQIGALTGRVTLDFYGFGPKPVPRAPPARQVSENY